MPADNEVIEQPVVTPPAKDDNVTISRAELESIKRESAERNEAAQYWSRLHSTATRTAEPAAEEEDEAREFLEDDEPDGLEGDTPEKLVDDFAAKGVAALKSRGFITAKDAQKLAVETALKVSREMIGRDRAKTSADRQIMTDFPGLKVTDGAPADPEFFKATSDNYKRAIARAVDPEKAKKDPERLYAAAELAREQLKEKAAAKRRNDDDDYEPEVESDRRRRADSQDSRPRGRSQADDRDDMLGDEARQVIKAMGITEAEFKASQKDTGSMGRRKR